MNRLEGQTAFISGATSGIGEACAVFLAKMGVNLVLAARREETLKVLKKKFAEYNIDVETLVLDVTQRESVKTALEILLEKKSIDILINNAGLALGLDKIDQGDIDDWEGMIDTNVKGLLYVSRVIIPQMRKRNRGHIINLGSIAGAMTYPNGNVYCATKAAVHALGEAMNIDLAGTSIRVSNIAPGAVETAFSNVRFHGDDQKADEVYAGYEPLRAEDIADLIVYILNAPKHVNIQHALIMPTAQRNPYTLHRDK